MSINDTEDRRDTVDAAEKGQALQSADVASALHADIIQLGVGFWGAKALMSAVELGLFTELAKQPLDAGELQTRLGLHPRATLGFLDSLVALGMLERENGIYRNAPASEKFLDEAKSETYIGRFFEFVSEYWYSSWDGLTTALRTGVPQNNAKDGQTNPFDVIYSDSERLRKFQHAMTGISLGGILALVEKFPWSKYQSVADIGCSEGTFLIRALRRHQHLTGIGFDLPRVAPHFDEAVAQADLAHRVSFVSGDFFANPLPQADVISFGHVLHNWDLETKHMLLRKAYEALPEDGVVVLRETLIDDERRNNTVALMMSLQMLMVTPDGFEFTGRDCRKWLAEAGFRDSYIEHLSGAASMIVGIK